MKIQQIKTTNGLRLRLKNAQAEVWRLMHVYENWGIVTVKGSAIVMSEWLVSGRPKRSAHVDKSPDASQLPSQSDASQQSEPTVSLASDAFSDDVTEEGEVTMRYDLIKAKEWLVTATFTNDTPLTSLGFRKGRTKLDDKLEKKEEKKEGKELEKEYKTLKAGDEIQIYGYNKETKKVNTEQIGGKDGDIKVIEVVDGKVFVKTSKTERLELSSERYAGMRPGFTRPEAENEDF